MRKAKITIVFEYDLDPEFYDDGDSPQEMLDCDLVFARDNGCFMRDTLIEEGRDLKITGEILPED